MILDLDQFSADLGLTTREQLLFALRQRYNSATAIIELTMTELQSKDPALVEFCDHEMSYFFDDLGNCFYDCWDGVRHALENGPLLASKPTTGDMRGVFQGMPAIVLGAGPGAAHHWSDIRASRGHAVLIVCDVMLTACLNHGIVPDFVSAMERTPQVYESLQDTPTAGTTLIGPAVLEKRVIDHFHGSVIWSWRHCGLEQWIAPDVTRNNFGRSCGTQGVSVALLAGCSPVYLVGHDLCMSGDLTHAAEAQASVLDTTAKIHADTDEYHARIPAKSISGRDVQTTLLWQMFKADIEYMCAEYPGQVVVNTGDGLAIRGTCVGLPPETWGLPIAIPGIHREKPGKNRRDLAPLMLAELPLIEKAMREAMEMTGPDYKKLQLSSIVSPETAQIWTEIYGGTYSGALIRMYLQPPQWVPMLKRVANTVIHTLPLIRKGLEDLLPHV